MSGDAAGANVGFAVLVSERAGEQKQKCRLANSLHVDAAGGTTEGMDSGAAAV